MAEMTQYPPGTFSWAELATSDPEAAKQFYASLFGWSYEDRPVGEGMVYTMASLGGRDVAALFGSTDQPPHWNCYVTVASADETAARAQELGGTVAGEPFDVMTAGRMAVVTDPAGAAFAIWEPREHPGAGRINEPGALTWNDLVTPDVDSAAIYYGNLFGWTTEELPDGGGYRVIKNGERSNGGMLPLDPERMGPGTPPSWMPYFGHEDVDRLAGELEGLGGRLLTGPMEVGGGRVAIVADPQGAVFAAWTGPYED